MKHIARMSTEGKAPRWSLDFKTQTNHGRDNFAFSAKRHEDEQHKCKVSAWRTSANEPRKELWEQFEEALRRFDLGYNNMLHVVKKLKILDNPSPSPKKEE
jgi:hypothetical protein